MPSLDALDRQLLRAVTDEPRRSVLELARRLGVARGTVQSRLDKLERTRVIASWAPHLSAQAMGYPVTAFVTVEITQGRGHDVVLKHLAGVAQVLEAHTTTGTGDVLCRVVARSNDDLQNVMDQIVSCDGVRRTATVIALTTLIEHDAARLIPQVCAPGEQG